MNKFFKDLNFGQIYENELAKYLQPFYKSIRRIDGKFKPYDLICDDKIKYECKCDRLSFKTGNIAIEFKCNNQNSGISSTESDYYAYYIIKNKSDYDFYIIPTEDLRNKINDKKYKRIVKGGDGWRSEMYLFDLAIFKEYKK